MKFQWVTTNGGEKPSFSRSSSRLFAGIDFCDGDAVPPTLRVHLPRWLALTSVRWRSDTAMSSTVSDRRKFVYSITVHLTTITTTVLRPFFRDHPVEPVPEENFWTLWCKGRLTEADTPTIRMGATPSGLVTSAHLHHPPYFLQAGCPSCRPNQQRQSTEGN